MFEFFGVLFMCLCTIVYMIIETDIRHKRMRKKIEEYQKTDEFKEWERQNRENEWAELKWRDKFRDSLSPLREGACFYRDLPKDLRDNAARKLDFSYKKLGYFDWSNIDNNK